MTCAGHVVDSEESETSDSGGGYVGDSSDSNTYESLDSSTISPEKKDQQPQKNESESSKDEEESESSEDDFLSDDEDDDDDDKNKNKGATTRNWNKEFQHLVHQPDSEHKFVKLARLANEVCSVVIFDNHGWLLPWYVVVKSKDCSE